MLTAAAIEPYFYFLAIFFKDFHKYAPGGILLKK